MKNLSKWKPTLNLGKSELVFQYNDFYLIIFDKKLIVLIFFFEQNWSNVDRCVQKPNFTMFASEPNQNPSCEIIFFLNEKLNPNGAQDPNFLLTPSINKFALQKEEKKIKITVIMYYVQFTQLPSPPWPPIFFIQSILTVKPCLFCENKAKSC